jgi:hypothetical protein
MFRNRALLILVIGSLGLVACGDDAKDTNNTTNNTTSNNTTNNATNNVATNNTTNNGTNNVATNNDTNNGTNGSTDIEILGTWDNSFDATETIATTTWDNGFEESIIELYGNDDNYAVLHSPIDAEYAPDTYSLVEWTEIDTDSFYYCTVDFALDSVDEALNSAAVADANDLDGEGCGGFPWTKMTRQ